MRKEQVKMFLGLSEANQGKALDNHTFKSMIIDWLEANGFQYIENHLNLEGANALSSIKKIEGWDHIDAGIQNWIKPVLDLTEAISIASKN